MATALKDMEPAIDPLDVSRAELYRDDTWHEPFRKLRAEAPPARDTAYPSIQRDEAQ